ncbi:DUF4124 domain-containing protein [uncultured Pseudoalteromonas sp.]|uniref:DUF4124 domain-containing protein n=1 Tax=uncultured Pseudoalteromonas sp. TaxID=114053 RepID=UPI00261B0D74|nr:DUF4124 domain-containing protein [uncultured Pseudoalteromonas sp.]
MKAIIIYLISLTLLCFTNKPLAATTEYYKCVTDRGTVFSEFPCGSRATKHKIQVTDPDLQAPQNSVKELNELERQQIIRNLEAEIRSYKHRLDILSRDRDRAQYQQEQRLNRILSDKEAKQINKDIKKQLKAINKQYGRDVKSVNKKLAKLEKKLARYN